jgi:hypothetical protein
MSTEAIGLRWMDPARLIGLGAFALYMCHKSKFVVVIMLASRLDAFSGYPLCKRFPAPFHFSGFAPRSSSL